jgi:class 3 adenylate cyclase/tetratricopeptide (TPR) repeat protein
VEQATAQRLKPYVPRLVIDWLRHTPDTSFREVEGTLVFVDISGFTSMTERLARKGKVGAEEMNDLLDLCFSQLLAVAYEDDAGLVKWGGDAVLLLFEDEGHAARACRAAYRMRQTLRGLGRLQSSAGYVSLRMSVGVHSGTFQFFLVGGSHRELVVAGPAATHTVLMESMASAGEILVSAGTAGQLDPRLVGAAKGDGFLLRRMPEVPFHHPATMLDISGLDLASCLPIRVREHLLSASHDAEHRHCAIAFVEFRGTDELLELSGPGAAALALDQCIRTVQDAAERHGVTFLDTDISADGGKILLLAGAPTATGADEEGMLLAVRAISDRSQMLSTRIGVNAGRIFTGDFGPAFRRTYSIKGDAANLAARIMGKAAPGQILVTEAVLERSATSFETEALEPFAVKGKKRPVQAFSLGAAGRRVLFEDERMPLVGRGQELSELLAALDSALTRRGRVVDIVGEPGIGKSRLVDELTSRSGGITVLIARCEMYERSTPYYPFRSLLRELLGIHDGADGADVAARLRDRAEANAPHLLPWLPLLGIPLDVVLPPTPETLQVGEDFLRAKLAATFVEFLEWVLPAATIMVFDDVHWMDDASTELLQQLVERAEARPWLICLTRRDQDGGFHLPEPSPALTLKLTSLEPGQVADLVATTTEEQPIPAYQMAELVRRSGGNPLFLRELIAAARRFGYVDALPDTVEELMTAQIDLLPPAERTLLRYASVFGASVDPVLLREVLPADLAVGDEAWSRLGEFLDRDDETWRFRHALIRDAAYEGLPFRRRRELHRTVGTTLERGAGPDAAEHAELLSLHFFHGQEHDRAWTYSRMAGERAQAKYALVEATDFYRRAIESGRVLKLGVGGQLRDVYESLGDVQERLGAYAEAKAVFQEARRLSAGDPVAQARLSLKEARIREAAGRYSDAVRWVRRGERSLEGLSTEEAKRQRAQLSVWHAVLRQSQGRHLEAARWCERAIALAEEAGDREALAHAYYILDWTYMDLGQPEKAVYSKRALAIYEELDDLPGQAVVYNNLGAWAYYQGKWQEAVEFYAKGREAREKTGDAVSGAMGTSNIGEIRSDQGRLEEAEPLFREALRIWRAAGFRAGTADAMIHLGRVESRSGRFEEALALFEGARAEYVDVGAGALVLETDARIAECLLFQGAAGPVLELTAEALQRGKAMGGGGAQMAMLHRLRGYAHMQLRDLKSARDALEESLGIGRSRQADFEVALTLRALADLVRLEGGDSAGPLEAQCQAILDRLGVVSLPRVPLEEGDTLARV